MSDAARRPGRRSLVTLAVLIALVAVAATVLVVRSRRVPTPDPVRSDPFPIPPLTASPHVNADLDVAYVGSAACATCHESRTTSFRNSGMGRSMASVDPAREPADGTFDHPKSQRRYQIVRHDGRLWHRELLLVEGPEEVFLQGALGNR